MSVLIRNTALIVAMLVALASLVIGVSAQLPSNHDQELGVPGFITGRHASGFFDPFNKGCVFCHGADLQGGIAPTCFSCHGAFWNATQPQYPASHTLEISGNRGHTAHQAECMFCHDVFGDIFKKTSFWHAPGHGTPLASGCTQCHGPNLDGVNGIAYSCYWCHDRLWSGDGPPSDHSVELGGFALHKPGQAQPVVNGCTQCHGPNLDDGFAPSCFSCHGPGGSGRPADHAELKGGFAWHKLGFEDPFTNCTLCHGPNLNDGYATSCLNCHGPGGITAASHTVELGGFAQHQPGYHDPLRNGCSSCHGRDLRGGLGPSCYRCHGELWSAGTNVPPAGLSVLEAVDVDGVPTVYGDSGRRLTFTAVVATNTEEDPLTFQWSFGDGTPISSPSHDPVATHAFDNAMPGDVIYHATFSVTDGINEPVLYAFDVAIGNVLTDPNTTIWDITTSEPNQFSITFRNNSGSLLGFKTDGSLALGTEMGGIIFWIDLRLNPSAPAVWGTGNVYFGNVHHEAGTMSGVVLREQGGIFTFNGTQK